MAQGVMGAGQTEDGRTAHQKDIETLTRMRAEGHPQADQFERMINAAEKQPRPKTHRERLFEELQTLEDDDPRKTEISEYLKITKPVTPKQVREEAEAVAGVELSIQGSQDTLLMIDDIRGKTLGEDGSISFDDKWIDAVTGYRGRMKTVTQEGFDAEVKFDQLKDSLTLENLSKMPGVLTDKDIKILANAASGLEMGMSKPEFKKRLQFISKKLNQKIDAANKKLEATQAQNKQGAGAGVRRYPTPPPVAIEALLNNPELADFFIEKYGALPEGF